VIRSYRHIKDTITLCWQNVCWKFDQPSENRAEGQSSSSCVRTFIHVHLMTNVEFLATLYNYSWKMQNARDWSLASRL